MDNSHGNYNFIFHFRFTDHIELPDEMLSNSNQRILRPSLQPVDCATTDQTWEFQCTTSELLSNLWVIKVQSMIFDVFGRDQYSLSLGMGSKIYLQRGKTVRNIIHCKEGVYQNDLKDKSSV